MTSRNEHRIQESLQFSVDYVVAIQNQKIDADVDLYVRECLKRDPDLCEWDDELKVEIVRSLTLGAGGMYILLVFI
jgi:hypothetical protein